MYLRLLSEHLVDRRVHSSPISLFLGQLLPAGGCQRVRFRATSAFQLSPFAFDPAAFFQAMESREERTGADDEHSVRHLFDPVRDAYSVQWSQFQRPENEEVQRALKEFTGFGHG